MEDASGLIEAWFDESVNEGLEAEWQKVKAVREAEFDRVMELEITLGHVDEWRDLYQCNPVSLTHLKSVFAVSGPRLEGEPIDKFMDRCFAELRNQRPELFPHGFVSRQRNTMSDDDIFSKKEPKPPRQPLSFSATAFAVMLGILLAEQVRTLLVFLIALVYELFERGIP